VKLFVAWVVGVSVIPVTGMAISWMGYAGVGQFGLVLLLVAWLCLFPIAYTALLKGERRER